MKKITFTNGEMSEIRNDNTHQRTTLIREKVSMELKYVDIDKLNYILNGSDEVNTEESASFDNFAESMIDYDAIYPILVYPNDDAEESYTIIDGEKRVKASIMMNKQAVLANVLYNVTPKTAIVMRMAANQTVFKSPSKQLEDAEELRNITSDYDDLQVEKMFNLVPGSLEKTRTIKRKHASYKYTDIQKDIDKIYFEYDNGKISADEAISQIEQAELKEQKKKEKQQKEIESFEQEEKAEMAEQDDLENAEKDYDQGKVEGIDSSLTEISNQNEQQYVGERQILSGALTRQIHARDSSMCAICGYGGKQNPSVAAQLEKHHIVDVQYGGKDNIDDLILICPNDHKLVTMFLNGKANEYNPSAEDLANNPNNWANVVLGNMGRLAKKNSLAQIKEADERTYLQVLKHRMTIGQAIRELKLSPSMPKEFNHSPYEYFKQTLFKLKRNVEGFELFNPFLVEEYEKNIMNLDDTTEEMDKMMVVDEQNSEENKILNDEVADVAGIEENTSILDKINKNREKTEE